MRKFQNFTYSGEIILFPKLKILDRMMIFLIAISMKKMKYKLLGWCNISFSSLKLHRAFHWFGFAWICTNICFHWASCVEVILQLKASLILFVKSKKFILIQIQQQNLDHSLCIYAVPYIRAIIWFKLYKPNLTYLNSIIFCFSRINVATRQFHTKANIRESEANWLGVTTGKLSNSTQTQIYCIMWIATHCLFCT